MNRAARNLALALAAPVAAAALAAPAGATIGGPVTTIGTTTAAEGTIVTVNAKVDCPTFTSCQYRMTGVSGSAVAGTDFLAKPVKRSVKRRKKLTLKMRVTVLADGICDANETYAAHLEGIGAGDDDYFVNDQVQRITDVDCAANPAPAPAPNPAPAPAPAQPAPAPAQPAPAQVAPDTGTPTETTTNTTNGMIKECRTPMWTGVQGQYGAWGHFISGCKVTVPCPQTARVCKVANESAINSERNIGQRVTMNTRMRAMSASGSNFWFRDRSCDGTDWCRAEDTVNIRGGESASVECNGVRASGPAANRAAVRCSVAIETLY